MARGIKEVDQWKRKTSKEFEGGKQRADDGMRSVRRL